MRFIYALLTWIAVVAFVGCDRYGNVGDVAAGVASGGLLPLPKNYDSLCEWGLEKCDQGASLVPSGSKLTNRPPRIDFYVSKLDMNVGDRRNLLLNVVDPDDDNISKVDYFIEDPSMAVLKLTSDPYVLEVAAKKEGNTNIRIIAKDGYLNEGRSALLPLAILDPNATMNRQVKLTKNLVELEVGASDIVKYVYTGFKPSYTVTPTTNNSRVEVAINQPSETITIKALDNAGTDEIQLTFSDGVGDAFVARIQILVKAKQVDQGGGDKEKPDGGGETKPTEPVKPKEPTETDLVVYNDKNACLTASPWVNISHRWSATTDKTVSNNNSLSIQSLTSYMDDKGKEYDTVVLYYQEKTDILDTPFGIDIKAPQGGLPVNAQRRDPKLSFILQANPSFVNNGYFYLEIGPFCYRGKWPSSTSNTQSQLAQLNIKLVLNNGVSPTSANQATQKENNTNGSNANSNNGNASESSNGSSSNASSGTDNTPSSGTGDLSPLPTIEM